MEDRDWRGALADYSRQRELSRRVGSDLAGIIESLGRCRIIARYGPGIGMVDLEAAAGGGIVVSDAGEDRPMRIKSVDGFRVSLPLPRTVHAAGYEIRSRDYHMVRLRTASGLEGWGYTLGRGADITNVIEKTLAPLIIGEDAILNERLWQKLYRATLFAGQKGMLVRAISMVDIAVWDIKARAAGLPLFALLGGDRRSVPVNAVGGYYTDSSTPAELHDEVRRLADLGYGGVKITAGGASREEDESRLASARRALGGGRLMVDINWSWSDVKTAIATARQWQRFDLAWIEEPFPPENLRARRQFARAVEIPLALGDEQYGRWTFRSWIEAEAVDILRPDATVVGGVTEFAKIAGLAASCDIPLAPHYYPDVHVHLASAFGNTLALETFDESSGLDAFHLLCRRPLRFHDGLIDVPDEPGLGLEVDLDALERYGVR